MAAHQKYLTGFLILQSFSTIVFIVGYFQSPQSLKKQSGKKNPFFERDDWFIPEFTRIVFFIGDQIDYVSLSRYTQENSNYCLQYDLDFQVQLNSEDLLNVLMRGVNPLSFLQYGLVDMQRWDSLPHQIYKQGKQFYMQSDILYDQDYTDVMKYITFDNELDIAHFVKTTEFQMLYCKMDSQSSLDVVSLAEEVWNKSDNETQSTLFMVLQKPLKEASIGTLWIVSPQEWLGHDVRKMMEAKMHPIDSITSTLSCLLNIPIPIQNHGLILPGIYFDQKVKLINDTFESQPELAMLYDQLVNLEQLATHLYLLDKQNVLFKSQEQKRHHLMTEFFEQEKIPNKTLIINLLHEVRGESMKINQWLNEEISGNIIVLLVGVILGLASQVIYIVRSKTVQSLYYDNIEILKTDKVIFGMILVICLVERRYQLIITGCSVVMFFIFTFRLLTEAKVKILGKLLVSVIYLCFSEYLLGKIIWLFLISNSVTICLIFLRGLFIVLTGLRGNSQQRIISFVMFVSAFFSYLPIVGIQELSFIICLFGSMLQMKLSRNMNLLSRILLFLLLNFGYVNNWLPVGILASITFLCLVDVQLSEYLDIGRQDNIFVTPSTTVIYILVYQSLLYQLPQSPLMTEQSIYFVQIYGIIYFICLREFLVRVYNIQKASLSVKWSLSQWSLSVEKVILNDDDQQWNGDQLNIRYQDFVICTSFIIWVDWLFILVNEVFHYNTTPLNLGQEYFYLQDSLVYLCLLFIIIFSLKLIDRLSNGELQTIELSGMTKQSNNQFTKQIEEDQDNDRFTDIQL